MDIFSNMIGRTETWLLQDGMLRRPLSHLSISREEFRALREPHVHYVIIQRVYGTFSDGSGSRPLWKRVH